MLWTAETVEDLRRLALEGKSASHIAAALGVGSRNAVIGKASRIGIKLNGGGRAAGSGKRSASGREWARAPRPDAGVGDVVRVFTPTSKKGPAAWALGEAEIGEMRRLRFEDIREPACRWPLGDPRGGDFTYCGLTPAKGQSYCAGHCRMAYRPPQSARAAAEARANRTLGSSWRLA